MPIWDQKLKAIVTEQNMTVELNYDSQQSFKSAPWQTYHSFMHVCAVNVPCVRNLGLADLWPEYEE